VFPVIFVSDALYQLEIGFAKLVYSLLECAACKIGDNLNPCRHGAHLEDAQTPDEIVNLGLTDNIPLRLLAPWRFVILFVFFS
jgi:hypothetical protein